LTQTADQSGHWIIDQSEQWTVYESNDHVELLTPLSFVCGVKVRAGVRAAGTYKAVIYQQDISDACLHVR